MAENCHNASQFSFFIDGDYSLNVAQLLNYLKQNGRPKFYSGKVWKNAYVHRDPTSPHYLSFETYPFQFFPPYIAAGGTILSADIVRQLHIISKYTKYIPFDDVFYGMVAKKLGINLVDSGHLLPAWDMIPRVDNREGLSKLIGSHRRGNLTEVRIIYDLLKFVPA